MGKTILDTSAIIKYLDGTLSANGRTAIVECLGKVTQISFITEIELQVWSPANTTDMVKLNKAIDFIKLVDIIGVNSAIIASCIHIRKTYRLKLPDAIIAATALVYDYTLISDNDKDFKKIPDLKYINPMKL